MQTVIMIRPLLMEQTHLGANSNYDQALSYGLYISQTPSTASDVQAHTTGILEDVDMCCLLCLCAYMPMCLCGHVPPIVDVGQS